MANQQHASLGNQSAKMHGAVWQTVANAAALAALVIVADDVAQGKVVKQTDTNQYWVPLTTGAGATFTSLGQAIRESGGTNLSYGSIAANQFLQRVGTNVQGTTLTLITPPVNPTDNGKVAVANAGDFNYVGGTANDVLTYNGAAWAGSQSVSVTGNIGTTGAATSLSASGANGFITIGNAPATQGNIRMTGSNAGLYNGSGGSDFKLIAHNTGANTLSLNDNSAAGDPAGITQIANVNIGYTGNLIIKASGSARLTMGTNFTIGIANVLIDAALVGVYGQVARSSGTATLMTFQGQGNTGSGTVVAGGTLFIGGSCTASGAVTSQTAGDAGLTGGNSNGTSGTRIGGNVFVAPGNAATPGEGQLRKASQDQFGSPGTAVLRWNATGIGLFTAAPIAQPTRVGQATNSTGLAGINRTFVDVTTAGVIDPVKVNQNFANFVDNIWNNFEAKISQAASGIGLTA